MSDEKKYDATAIAAIAGNIAAALIRTRLPQYVRPSTGDLRDENIINDSVDLAWEIGSLVTDIAASANEEADDEEQE